MAKIQPAARTLMYVVTPSSGAFDVVLDLAKDLSAVNRRLYRQGMQYLVANVKVATGKGLVVSACSTAGDTWMVHNAWKKGFHLWKNQQNEVNSAFSGDIQGKWADFKVELWDGAGTPLTPVVGSDDPNEDEWNLSNYVWDDDGTERQPTFCIIGSSAIATKIGLIQEYHISRNQAGSSGGEPLLPSEASDSIFAKSLGTDEMSDLLLDVVESDNDLPPYDANEMFGGDTVGDEPIVQDISFASEFNPSNTGPFTAECGLVRINGSSKLTSTFPHSTNNDNSYDDIHYLSENLDEAVIVQVTLAPGPYKGVMATPMGQ